MKRRSFLKVIGLSPLAATATEPANATATAAKVEPTSRNGRARLSKSYDVYRDEYIYRLDAMLPDKQQLCTCANAGDAKTFEQMRVLLSNEATHRGFSVSALTAPECVDQEHVGYVPL